MERRITTASVEFQANLRSLTRGDAMRTEGRLNVGPVCLFKTTAMWRCRPPPTAQGVGVS